MAMQTEPLRTGEHVVSEANGQRSREQVMLLSGNLPAGAVVALAAAGEYEPVALEDITAPSAPAEGSTDTDTAERAELAVVYSPTDASDGPARCVIHKRDCEVIAELLGWPQDATDEQIAIGLGLLESAGIIAR